MSIVGKHRSRAELINPRAGFDAIYLYGKNNLYPYFIKDAIKGSATASLAHREHTRNIAGRLSVKNDVINKRSDLRLNSLVNNGATDLSALFAYAIHINYGYDFKREEFYPKDPTILPIEDVRLNKMDDHGNTSKVFVDDFSKPMKKKIPWYYKYTKNKDDILAQIRNDINELDIDISTDEGIEMALLNYRGQVRYLNFTGDFPYPESIIDPVIPDCVSEKFISKYTEAQTYNGFMGKKVAFIKEGDDIENKEIEKDLSDWIGADNSGGIYVKYVKDIDDIDKVMKVETFEPVFDDKLFETTSNRLRSNILGAFDNMPEVLAFTGDSSLFGTNPDTWINAEKYYARKTEYLRKYLQETLCETLEIEFELKPLVEYGT